MKGKKNLLVIPDCHAAPEYDNDRFTALGNYIVKEQPDIIVCLGDFGDMPSLSSYERYKKDVNSVLDAQEKLFAPIKKFNERKRKQKEKQYKPKMHMCLGNHEDRIDRAINSAPEMDGAISMSDLQYEKNGWKITPFKGCLSLEGINFSHYFTSGVAGRPISSAHIGHQLVSKLHCSAVQGHSHLYNHAEQTRKHDQTVKRYSG
jgi:predicted MPP superfamily phosphohydrolase